MVGQENEFWDEVDDEVYFPILISFCDTGEEVVIRNVGEIPFARAFVVVATQVKS